MSEPWDDAAMDAIALVELAGSEDAEGACAVLASCNATAVAAELARLVALVVNAAMEGGPLPCGEPGCFRAWTEAITRS